MIKKTYENMPFESLEKLQKLSLTLQGLCQELRSVWDRIDKLDIDIYLLITDEERRKQLIEEELKKFQEGFAYAPRQKPTPVRAKPKVHRVEFKGNKCKPSKASRNTKGNKG